MKNIIYIETLLKRKYEILLFSLLMHLYNSIFFIDLNFYTTFIWPINMIIIGISCIGVFSGTGKKSIYTVIFLSILMLVFPIAMHILGPSKLLMNQLTISYFFIFLYIFIKILKFLLKPSYINIDIISASACGYFLLVEMGTFLLQFIELNTVHAFNNINNMTPESRYLDFVYYTTITVTSIGYGDITPVNHISKMASSLIGVIGQFYSVILVGIIISKYSSKQ
jgi:hypothetical protein